ncbi:MAG: hypothetical protein GY880_18335 [Planctomycetaceae bacterium]|jgi:hypothetical protein|nr:hypothetical protein [Planctomycetaceae bacterium]MCP4776191.1 hypothetical protein [Planctomycetaceae bacterium]
MMDPITLQSNLSCESLVLVPHGTGFNGIGEYELTLSGQHWDGDHEHDIKMHVDSIILSHHKLDELESAIQAWLQTDQVGVSAFAGTFDLTSHFNSSLRFVFAEREDIISGDDKPVLTVEYSFSRMSGAFCFVTDQSCLALFASGIRSHLLQAAG